MNVALGYARSGIPVFPCGPDKRPLTRHGFKDATTDLAVVRDWWAQHADAMVATPTGSASDLAVLDVDVKHGIDGEASLAALEAELGPLPVTMAVRTRSGGRHLYFRHDGASRSSASRIAPGIDVRAEGGYVIAPGSPGYVVERTAERATLPAAWASRLAASSIEATSPVADQWATLNESRRVAALAWASASLAGLESELRAAASWPEGQRDDYGRGWEKLTADAYLRALRILAAVPDLDGAAWRARLLAAAPRDASWTERDVAEKWASQRSAAARKGPADLSNVGGSIFTATSDAPQEPTAGVPGVVPAVDWAALWADRTEEEWIVEPILPARRLVALYSPPKMGKSLLMLELAASVAAGRYVLGATPDRPRPVLYVDFENDPKSDVRPRLQAMGFAPESLGQLHYLSFPAMNYLDSAAGAEQLMANVRHYGAEVVVIDTVSRAVGGEENENDTWLSFYRHTGLALKQARVACIRLDHTGKDETKGQRGGSAKSGDVDAVWRLSEVVKDETYRLTCEANRMPVAEKVLTIRRLTEPLRHDVQVGGNYAAFEAKVAEAIRALDAADVDLSLGRDKARVALSVHFGEDYRVRNDVLSKALDKRRGPVPDSRGQVPSTDLSPSTGDR
ncbi:bifunctional DNA primase/polymerase [Occultella kanbiaonis]|uniref:bifunctional DNA primase/polymerase n=1 Tax=Occultella kanbiaonis TaxID=2675754 RepID=UPI0012B88053|nr:bifunctional DNA primase/polymerase [Occultella kanbiaonis]